ncbi:MAG: hypothetical protein PHW56_11290, partial [Methanosarcinaceae archaeon]|nr:hypothetical protein [Methanosarcinaceae archaeon]
KTKEERKPGPEFINYFNPHTEFKNGHFRLSGSDLQHYGHELCYYTKSYLGETVRLATKIVELDRGDKEKLQILEDESKKVLELPLFAQFLPAKASAPLVSKGISCIGDLWGHIDRDDIILGGHDLSLSFNKAQGPRLQSGRIVCIPGKEKEEFIGKYTLKPDNRLVDRENNEYTEGSYYVVRVENRKNAPYENFDHFRQAAELLEQLKEEGCTADVMENIIELYQSHIDMETSGKIEKLLPAVEMDAKKQVEALYRKMSPEMQKLYAERLKAIRKPEARAEPLIAGPA